MYILWNIFNCNVGYDRLTIDQSIPYFSVDMVMAIMNY